MISYESLIYRLIDYNKIKNVSEPVLDDGYSLEIPATIFFKDINASCDLPLDTEFYRAYFSSIGAPVENEKGKNMYQEKFLLIVRIGCSQNECFIIARVKSSHRTAVQYNIYVKISIQHKLVSEAQCECAAGNLENLKAALFWPSFSVAPPYGRFAPINQSKQTEV